MAQIQWLLLRSSTDVCNGAAGSLFVTDVSARDAVMPAGRAVSDRPTAIARLTAVWTILVLAIMVIAFTFAAPHFASRDGWIAVSQAAYETALLGLAQTLVIITENIDLSVGAVLGLGGMVAAFVMEHLLAAHVPTGVIMILGYGAGIVAGVIAGLMNGLLVTQLRVVSFLVTLGMLGAATGATDLINNGQEIVNIPGAVGSIGNGLLGGWMLTPVLVTAVLYVVVGCWLARTRTGRHLYAIGSDRQAAERAGIPVARRLVLTFVLSGVLAAIAGELVMSQFIGASPSAGTGQELNAIAAAVIGGTSFSGGRGSVLGTVVGALIIAVLSSGLVMADVNPFWQEVAIGFIIILAVYTDRIRLRLIRAE